MPARRRRAAPRRLPDASRRASASVALMVALGILALAKLGLLANDVLGLAAAGSAPAVEATLAAARPAPTSEDAGAPMPAAGPEAPASPPAPAEAASTAPETAAPPPDAAADPTAAAARAFDPTKLTASEVAVLQQLAGRRTELDRRAQELDQRQALLETATATLEGQIAQLSQLRNQIKSAIEQHDAAEKAKLESLVKIYEAMNAKAAAEIFNRLEMPVLIEVAQRMRERKFADVLARMDPVKARQVTTELARRTKLLGTAAPGATVAAAPPPNRR